MILDEFRVPTVVDVVYRRTREKWWHQHLGKIKVVATLLASQWMTSDFCSRAQDVEEEEEVFLSFSCLQMQWAIFVSILHPNIMLVCTY